MIPRALSLAESCSNNVPKYSALLTRMQHVEEIGIKHLEAYGDSKLIVNQVHKECEIWHEDLVPYHKRNLNLAEKFKSFYINHVPRQ